MAPLYGTSSMGKRSPSFETGAPTRSRLTGENGFLESWAQGYHVGSLIILILIVFCNYRPGVLLHKLILLELVLALWHGTFIFFSDPTYGWYLSSTATLLFISYTVHNIVSWLKIRPFLPRWGSLLFIWSLVAVQPFWAVEAWSNFEYFNNMGSRANVKMRPWEALVRDPWWIFTTWKLLDAIKKTYSFKLWELIKINSRFGVMLVCMFISIVFLFTDIVVTAVQSSTASGINPYWRFALVFKCASDTIFLDDFRTVLDDIIERRFYNSEHGNGVRRGSVPETRRRSLIDMESREMVQPRAPKRKLAAKLRHPFAPARSSEDMPLGIHMKKEINVTSEQRKISKDSFTSERPILSRPPGVIHAHSKDDGSEPATTASSHDDEKDV